MCTECVVGVYTVCTECVVGVCTECVVGLAIEWNESANTALCTSRIGCGIRYSKGNCPSVVTINFSHGIFVHCTRVTRGI